MKKTLLLALLLSGCATPPPTAVQVQKDLPSPVQRTALISPVNLVSFTLQMGPGRSDGEHIFWGKKAGAWSNSTNLPVTNQFSLPLDTNSPTLIEVCSFTNLPTPIVQMFTNDDGTTESITNTFADLRASDIVYVPTNCPRIGLFQTTNGFVLTGWAPTNLTIQQSPDRVHWSEITHVTSVGQFQIQVDSSQPHLWFRTTSQ
jgi:hypothetical protein